jgi:purine-binding chemotaxis protein CheW
MKEELQLESKTALKSVQTLITFVLEGNIFALPIEPVRQIIEMVTITPIPQVDHGIEGVINFHGVVVPILNLRQLLGLSVTTFKIHTPIILVTIKGKLIGLIVDQVLDVLERPVDQIINPGRILLEEMGEIPLLQGLIQSQIGSILLLNLEHLFKSYQSRSLLDVVDSMTQTLEQGRLTGVEVPQSVETAPLAQNAEIAVQNKPEAQPAKGSKKRSRKKADAKPETTKEVAA